MHQPFTQEYLKSILDYNQETGAFKKLKCRRTDWIGKEAGAIDARGYRHISIHNKRYLAHHLAWFYMTGEWPEQIDHRNNTKGDDRFFNLRKATPSQNMHNQGKRCNNTSGYKGVTYNKKARKWLAQIRVNWEQIYLGLYDKPEVAHQAYCIAAKRLHGEFARFA